MAILMSPPYYKPGFEIKEFLKGFQISSWLLRDGIVFIWTEKEYIYDIIISFEKQGLKYIENMCWIKLDQA